MNNNVKLFISRTLKFVALLLPLACLVCFAQKNLFFFEDANTRRLERFYLEEENSIDVVVMGASETFTGFAPGYAYENFGFTSYVYGMDSNLGSLYLPQLKEVLKHQDPQVILVDVYGFLWGEDWGERIDEARFRIFVESIPFSMNKVQTILSQPYDNKISYFMPYIKYHGEFATAKDRLLLLGEEELELPDLKGIITETVIYDGEGHPGETVDPDTYGLSEEMIECLNEFLDYCEKNNVDDNVVFVNFPRFLECEDTHNLLVMATRVEEIVEARGYELLNLQKEKPQIGIDVNHDFYNMHHLNIYGQMKLTDYLGDKLINEYNVVPTEQSAENQAKWEKCMLDTRQYFQMVDALIDSGFEYIIYEAAYEWFNPAEILNAA